MIQKRLAGQTALVTGSSSGIGKAIAIAFANEGANIIINYNKNEEGADNALDEVKKAGSNGIVVKADVSKEEDVKNIFEAGVKEFGSIDILVNNSGIEVDKDLVDLTLADWNKVLDLNLTGYFLCARGAARQFLKQGVKKENSAAAGKMIFINSVHDRIPWAGHSNYTASKGGAMMFMQSIAQELAPQKIRVNAISPGAIRTSINKAAWGTFDAMEKLLKMIPYQRIGEPEDVAKVAAFLASDESDYITGTTIYVDGGMTLYPEFAHGG